VPGASARHHDRTYDPCANCGDPLSHLWAEFCTLACLMRRSWRRRPHTFPGALSDPAVVVRLGLLDVMLTLVTLPVTLKAHLRAADLPRLRASGPLGELLARQGEAHGEDHGMAELGRAHAGLPDDLLNFQYDPVACAVTAGWEGAVVEEQRLRPVVDGGVMRFQPDQDGQLTRVVVDLDGEGFTETWLAAVEAAQQGPWRRERF
jgi:hypothetical protein